MKRIMFIGTHDERSYTLICGKLSHLPVEKTAVILYRGWKEECK